MLLVLYTIDKREIMVMKMIVVCPGKVMLACLGSRRQTAYKHKYQTKKTTVETALVFCALLKIPTSDHVTWHIINKATSSNLCTTVNIWESATKAELIWWRDIRVLHELKTVLSSYHWK